MADTNVAPVDVDDIIEAYGDYYLDNGQNINNLHLLPFEQYESQNAGTIIETDQTVLREANVELQSVLQQYQTEFTSKGGVKMKPVSIPLYRMKIDTAFVPQELVGTWAQFLTDSGNDPLTFPFIKWITEVYLLQQSKEDMEMEAFYKGVFKEPEEGVPGEPDETMNGIEKHFSDLIASGELVEITTGAIPADDKEFVDQVEQFVESVPERYRKKYKMDLNMNRTLVAKFKRGMRKKYNIYYEQTSSLVTLMDNENITIAGRASMMGKSRYWMTPKFNLLVAVKGLANSNGFDVQKQDRKVKFLTDWWTGVGFVQPKLIWLNNLT